MRLRSLSLRRRADDAGKRAREKALLRAENHDAAFVRKSVAPILKESDTNANRQIVDELPAMPLYPSIPSEVYAGVPSYPDTSSEVYAGKCIATCRHLNYESSVFSI